MISARTQFWQRKNRGLLPATALWAVAAAACTPEERVESFVLEVSYESEAPPYTGSTVNIDDPWTLFEVNMEALFEGTAVTIESPSVLDEMQDIGILGEASFTSDRILELDTQFRRTEDSKGQRVFHALWLDGYFFDRGEQQTQVIGVSIGDTGVIAMFKPVIESMALLEGVRGFGEQTTLVHEVGHALGLVNNGVAMQKDHLDEENGAHCDDDGCVMFWANEGIVDLVDFVVAYIDDGNTVLFDDDCLLDIQTAYTFE